MKQSAIIAVSLVVLLIPAMALAAQADRLVITRASETVSSDEIVVLLDVVNTKNLNALDIPLGFSEGAVLEKVEFTDRVKGFEFLIATIYNDQQLTLIGMMTIGPSEEIPDLSAGSGTIAKMYFKLEPGTTELEISPIEMDLPNHSLTYYYEEESNGRIEAGTIHPEVEGTFFRLGDEALPTVYGLRQNSPNPFNPTTSISYSLPEPGYVTLSVYNVLGQNVRDLVSDYMEAGTHTVIWDGQNRLGELVASGVYFYRLKADDFERTRKMMLLK